MSFTFRFKIYLTSLMILFVIGFSPSQCRAFFKVIEASKAFEPIRSPMGLGKDVNISGIGIYENKPDDENSFISDGMYHPAYLSFSPLDVISLKKLIPLRYSSSLTAENQLSQMIYANIKIKRLIDEYTQLQSRMHSYGSVSRDKIAITRTAIAKKGQYASSRFTFRQAMEQDQQELTRLAMRQMDSSQDINLLLSLAEFVENMNKDFLDKNTKEILFSEDQELSDFRQTEVDLSEENGNESGFGDPSSLPGKNSRRNMKGPVKEPPRIINMFAAAVEYFFNNKLEVMFYFSILAAIFFVLTSAVRR